MLIFAFDFFHTKWKSADTKYDSASNNCYQQETWTTSLGYYKL